MSSYVKTFFLAAACILLLSSLLVSPVDAQPRTTLGGEPLGRDAARTLMAKFADCLTEREPKLAKEYVLHYDNQENDFEKFRAFFSDAYVCFRRSNYHAGSMKLSRDLLRYLLAESFVTKEVSLLASYDFSAVEPLSQPKPDKAKFEKLVAKARGIEKKKEVAKNWEHAQLDHLLSIFGECTARENPVDARRLLSTKLSSDAERLKFKDLTPALNVCAEKHGGLAFDMMQLRGAIALNYYRLVERISMELTSSKGAN